jgi:prevent-host-death family protein
MKAKGKATISVAQFKDRCLRVMAEVSATGMEVTVTKRGKPLVRIVPVVDREDERRLEGAIVHQDEEIFSTGETWEAER